MPDKFAIGSVKADLKEGAVYDGSGAVTHLRPKTAEVLRYLLGRTGALVSRDELINAIWPGVYVTENGLSQCVTEIRRALGTNHSLLRTLPRRGYILDSGTLVEELNSVAAALGEGSIHAHPIAPSGAPVVAVLPFRFDPSQPRLARIADVLLDSLVGALATSREPVVISANSTRFLAAETTSPSEMSRQLGASYFVNGHLHGQGDHICLTLELSEGAWGSVVWHCNYNLTEETLFQEPARLAAGVAYRLLPKLRDAELRKARRERSHNLSAYHLMLEARVVTMRLDPDEFEKARHMLMKAAELDPGFAPAREALANWYSLRIGQHWSIDSEADTRSLISEAQSAIELDSANGRALALLGHTQAIRLRDYDSAQELLDQALEACPNDAEARMWATPTLAYVGRIDEAIANAEQAILLSPMDPLRYRYEHFLSIAHYCNGDFHEAANWGLRSMRRNTNYTSNYGFTIASLVAIGNMPEANALARKFQQLRPGFRVSVMMTRTAVIDEFVKQQFARHLEIAGLPP